MSFRFKSFVAVAALIATSQVAMAQGVPGGMERGARDGERAAGPVGAAVGAAVGGVVGGVAGVLGVDDRPRFRTYVQGRNVRSYTYAEPVSVGTVLPADGVAYYDVPDDYASVREYRYTVVNDRTVLVDPRTRRVVQIVE